LKRITNLLGSYWVSLFIAVGFCFGVGFKPEWLATANDHKYVFVIDAIAVGLSQWNLNRLQQKRDKAPANAPSYLKVFDTLWFGLAAMVFALSASSLFLRGSHHGWT